MGVGKDLTIHNYPKDSGNESAFEACRHMRVPFDLAQVTMIIVQIYPLLNDTCTPRYANELVTMNQIRTAVAAQAGSMLIAIIRQKHHITPQPVRWRSVSPHPKTSIRNAHQAADIIPGKLAVIPLEDFKLHGS